MIKRILLGVLLAWSLIILISLVFPTKAYESSGLIKKWNRSFVSNSNTYPILRLVDPVKHIGCTIFIIDDTYAITAAHCLNSTGELPDYTMKAYLNNSYVNIPIRAGGYDTPSDMGLVTGDFAAFSPLHITLNEQINFKDKFVACGYPRGQKEVVCNDFVPVGRNFDVLKGISQFHHGMSGGPLIDITIDKVVGIISALDEDGYGYVVPLEGFMGVFPQLEP